jgi:glycine cleavage system T protein
MSPQHTPLHDIHRDASATMIAFGGWQMPLQYPNGILHEHLATRAHAGLFDVSHMGRFLISGGDALDFLQHVLSNNAAALDLLEAQYTMIPNETGGAIDDAYLYRFVEDAFLLVVNAANRERDLAHFKMVAEQFSRVKVEDKTREMAMFSLQGPQSRALLEGVLEGGSLPEPLRNQLSSAHIAQTEVLMGRTGYTGEPVGFELFFPAAAAERLWQIFVERGATPCGLGARDTLRLEAGLPLYGHELGLGPGDKEIPIFALSLARFAVSLSPLKGDFIGRAALTRQFQTMKRITDRDYSEISELPRLIRPVEITGRGVARAGNRVFAAGRAAGHITSGTVVPYWIFEGAGLYGRRTKTSAKRAIALALVDSSLVDGDEIQIEVRGKHVAARIVPYHLRSEAPPYSRPITCHDFSPIEPVDVSKAGPLAAKARTLIQRAIGNTRWRRQDCINLIPSEMTPSPAVRWLSIMDPAGRYAEHKALKAFCEEEVFYYQGTDFIADVEALLVEQMRRYLGCAEVETRVISGQMANSAVFSALVDFRNRADRKNEQQRIHKVFNHHIIKGGHLSAQPMGAMRDFVIRDPVTEKPAVINFPVLSDDPYQIDIPATAELMAEHRPELVIFGKSMVLYREPVAQISAIAKDLDLDCHILYDTAHVLGLLGPHFQMPFKEGATLVTGSTHKTFFGTQRGIIACDYQKDQLGWDLWEAIQRRSFPGSTSNHHLGTLLGLLMAAYEMNAFADAYQKNVIGNAKAFARALRDCGLQVAGNPEMGFTETHQVIVQVGYAEAPRMARRLEENNIILNYQAAPQEEGFTAAGALRMGASEMTRFGMGPSEFQRIAQFIHDVVVDDRQVKTAVSDFRKQFKELAYCFSDADLDGYIQRLHAVG